MLSQSYHLITLLRRKQPIQIRRQYKNKRHLVNIFYLYMSRKIVAQKKFTVLIRKLTLQHDLTFMSISQNAGETKTLKATSECVLNEEIPVIVYEDGTKNNTIQLHIIHNIHKETIQMGTVTFDYKNEKILKPLSKQFFSKQLNNKNGYIQYKFIAVESKNASQQDITKNKKMKNQLLIQLDQNRINKQEINDLMLLINEKDQIISQMSEEAQRLMVQTKKLNKSLSKEKAFSAQQVEKSININLKIPTPTVSSKSATNLKINADWQRQKNEYDFKIEKLERKLRDFETRQKHYKQQLETLRKTMTAREKQTKVSDLRKQLQDRYVNEDDKYFLKRLNSEKKINSNQDSDEQKKNSYIEEQLAEQIKIIEAQKKKQYKKDIQLQVRMELQKQHLKEKQKEKSRQSQRPIEREKSKSRSFLRESVAQHREFLSQIRDLEDERQTLRLKLQMKDQQLHGIVMKLERAQKEIEKLEDQNIELRKTKSSLLKQVQGMSFKEDGQLFGDRRPIQDYEKMIIKERKQIIDEKLKAEMQQLRVKNKRDEKQFKQKLNQKEMQIMKLKLSEQHANKQKQIYSNRIKQIMASTEGQRKNYLYALQGAHKFETQQTRTKQLEVTNNQLELTNNRLMKQKTDFQNSIKKMKAKLDQRQGQWVRLKSVEAQHDYYKTQCEKFEKAHKKFQKQYESIKQYCQNLEHVVGKKPRKTFDQEINQQREERHKNQIRNRLQALIQEVKQMENKFYMEQIQIWLTQRTSVIQYYAKKLEEQKARLLELDNINQQAKLNLIQQKEKQLSQLKDQQINDIDRKVAKLKIMIKSEEQKLVTNMIDKASMEQIATQLAQKLQKLQKQEEDRKKQLAALKEKNTKLQSDLKQKNMKINFFDNEHAQKRSLALYSDDKDSAKEDGRKSYIQQFKKSRELYMNKPFEELKKINNDLQTQKRRLQNQITNIKFGFEKQRFQFNEKIRNKQRQIKKIQNETASNQKNVAKMTTDVETLKKKNDQLQSCLRKTVDELKQVSRNLELKQIQCGEALGEIKRMQKNLIAYEDAEKRMFEDVKKLKDKMLVKQNQMQQVLQERDRKSKQIDAQRVVQIQKLVQKNKELEFKLQKQITQNISIKNENERLSQNITQYQLRLKSKEQEYEVLNETFKIYKVENMEKVEQYEQQNNMLQNNILEIADEIGKKQKQCTQLQIKIQYSQKRQKILSNIKLQLEEQIKSIKNINNKLEVEKDELLQKFDQQAKAYDTLLHKIDDYVHQNAQLQLQIQAMESQLKNYQSQNHEIEKEVIRKQGQINNLETKVEFLNEKINEQNKKLMEMGQKEKQLENLRSQRDRQGKTEEKSRKSSEGIELSPSSPMVQRKLLTTTSIHKSTSLINPPKSNKNLNLNVSITRKNSSKDRQIQQHQQMRYSKQGMELKVLRPVTETAQDLKVTMNMIKNKEENQKSKLNIQVQSEDQYQQNLMQINQNNSNIDIKTTFNSAKPETNKKNEIGYSKRPAQLSREQISQDIADQDNQAQLKEQIADLKQRVVELENQIEATRQQRNGFYEQLQIWKKTYEKQSNPNILLEVEKSLNVSKQPEQSKRLDAKKSTSNRFGFDSSNQDFERSNVKKVDQYEKQIEELKNKSLENQLTITQLQNQIKDLEQAIKEAQSGNKALISQLEQLLKRYELEVSNGKNYQKQIEQLQRIFQKKVSEYDKQIQNMVIEEMKKDETIKQALNMIDKLHIQLKQKDSIISCVQSQLQQHKQNIQKNAKKMNMNKNQYRKYQQQAQLQILRLKQKTDLLESEKNLKCEELDELAQRYFQIQSKVKEEEEKYKKLEYQMLVERSKAKEANDKKERALEEMKKYESSKKNLLDRLGDLQIKIGQKNQQIKEMTKQTSIRFKKYEIEIESLRQQTSRVKKIIKQRQEHITNLKMQMGNYNELCEKLEKQKNILNNDLAKMQKQIREIMISYQNELNELSRDKQSINKQLENTKTVLKQNGVKIEALNKQLSRKSRQNKQLVYKIDTLDSSVEKLKQKNSREVAQLLSNFQIKNDQCQKIKMQLQRETEHYFLKQCEFLADKQKREKLEKEYNKKLENYQKNIKQLQEEFKQLQNRPSIENWEEVCFENEIYKNRVEELEEQLKNTGMQQEERIIAEFKRYKIGKQKQIMDLESQMEKYGFKFHNMEQNNYVLKKDNESMKVQLRTLMQDKMRMQKSLKQYEQDIQELKQELNFYKAKRVDDLNKLLNQTYD